MACKNSKPGVWKLNNNSHRRKNNSTVEVVVLSISILALQEIWKFLCSATQDYSVKAEAARLTCEEDVV